MDIETNYNFLQNFADFSTTKESSSENLRAKALNEINKTEEISATDETSSTMQELYKRLQELYKLITNLNTQAQKAEDPNLEKELMAQLHSLYAQVFQILGQIMQELEKQNQIQA